MDERDGLRDPDLAQRVTAAENLSLMGPDASFAAVELVEACADDEAVRNFAVAALEELGPPPNDSRNSLTELVAHSDPLVAYWAITLLGRLGTTAKSSQDDLASALAGARDSSVRERAAWAMGQVGADSETAIGQLKTAAESSEARLARIAKASLDQIQVKQ